MKIRHLQLFVYFVGLMYGHADKDADKPSSGLSSHSSCNQQLRPTLKLQCLQVKPLSKSCSQMTPASTVRQNSSIPESKANRQQVTTMNRHVSSNKQLLTTRSHTGQKFTHDFSQQSNMSYAVHLKLSSENQPPKKAHGLPRLCLQTNAD